MLVPFGVCLPVQDKVEAAVDDGGDEVEDEMAPVEPLPEPPDDGGPVGWPMPEFCPITVSRPPRLIRTAHGILLSCGRN